MPYSSVSSCLPTAMSALHPRYCTLSPAAFARARSEAEGLNLDDEDGSTAAYAPAVPKGSSILKGEPNTLVLDPLFARRLGGMGRQGAWEG